MNKLVKIATPWAISLVVLSLSLWFYALGKSDWITAEWFTAASVLLGMCGGVSGAIALIGTIAIIMGDSDG